MRSPDHPGDDDVWLETLACLAAAATLAAATGGTPLVLGASIRQSPLGAPGASFVTLRQHGRLRGCIGSLQAHRALHDDVIANARAAALDDPRFAPVSAAEVDTIELDVYVLSTPEALAFRDETDLVRRLRPGVDGLIVTYRDRRATYLPSVWAELPEPGAFLRHLRHKAGIADDVPAAAITVQRYVTAHSAPVEARPAAELARTRGFIA
ncbi:MAG: AmmeMemoRadiSam system protein A [Gammaproteobacteria bacterium]